MLLASHCCICGRPLVDATSQEFGIGPVCRNATGYEDAYPVTAEAAAFITEHLEDLHPEFAKRLREALNQPLSRRAANLLTNRLALDLDDPDAQIRMIEMLGRLGYYNLATRILERGHGLSIRIEARDNGYLVRAPYHDAFRAQVKRFARGARDENGKWAGWLVPASDKGKLVALLKRCFPGQLAEGPTGVFRLDDGFPMLLPLNDHEPEPEPEPEPGPNGWVRMADDGRILVQFNFQDPTVGYHREWVDLVREVPVLDRTYQDRVWYINRNQAARVVALLPMLEIDPAVEALADEQRRKAEARRNIEQAIPELAGMMLGDMSQPIFGTDITLFAHQREGVKWLLERRKAILADKMGLGKTYTSLVAARGIQEAFGFPIICIVPAFLRRNWQDAAERLGIVNPLVGTPRIKFFSWARQPTPEEVDEILGKSPYYILIADEAHYAQSWTSKRSRRMRALAKDERCIAAFLLTGTPMKNGLPDNLGPLLDAIEHPVVADRRAYQERYCYARNRFTRDGWAPTGARHLDELHQRTRDAILMRRKEDVLDLPELTRVLQRVTLDEGSRKLYEETVNRLRIEHEQRVQENARLAAESGQMSYYEALRRAEMAEAIVTLNRLRHAGSVAKTPAAIEMALEVLGEGDQVVLFTGFKETAYRVAEAINKAGYRAEVLSGDVTGAKRHAMWHDRFQETGETRALVCTYGAAGVGIDLYAANVVILIDRAWTPGDNRQAEDRLHRIGQNWPVTSYWLQLDGWSQIDQKIDEILIKKATRIELVLEGARKTLRGVGGSLADIAKEIINAVLYVDDGGEINVPPGWWDEIDQSGELFEEAI